MLQNIGKIGEKVSTKKVFFI